MKKIGIVCASDSELEPILRRMKIMQVSEHAMLHFHEGWLGDVPAVAGYSGVGKVNAAVAAQVLIDRFSVDAMVCGGTAGGIADRVKVFDTVISEQIAYHDMAEDILTEFHPWLKSVWLDADRVLLCAAEAYSQTVSDPILFGRTVTGETFVEGAERAELQSRLSPLSVDMESAAYAHTCYVNRIPFLSIRTVTDNEQYSGAEHFELNCDAASEISAKHLAGVVFRWAEIEGRP